MNLQQDIVQIGAFVLLFIGAGRCQPNGPSVRTDDVDPQQVTSAVVSYHMMDQQTVLFDSMSIPPLLLHRFIRTWNESAVAEMRMSAPGYTIDLRLKDNERRTFRLNGNYAKEKNDWWVLLSDTTLVLSLDSLREINEYWFGSYQTENGAVLGLYRNGRYHYFMNQCTYGYSSAGTWTNVGDTLRLIADPEPRRAAGPLAGRFEWTSFDEPFVRKGRILYFTVEGGLNHHYFFTKE